MMLSRPWVLLGPAPFSFQYWICAFCYASLRLSFQTLLYCTVLYMWPKNFYMLNLRYARILLWCRRQPSSYHDDTHALTLGPLRRPSVTRRHGRYADLQPKHFDARPVPDDRAALARRRRDPDVAVKDRAAVAVSLFGRQIPAHLGLRVHYHRLLPVFLCRRSPPDLQVRLD